MSLLVSLLSAIALDAAAAAPQGEVVTPAPAASLQITPLTPISGSPADADGPGVVSLDELDGLRGGDGQSVIITEQALNAVNSGNSVTGATVVSGAISLGQSAFSGFGGVGNFSLNTGHNNNLQSSVSVSVIVTPQIGQ